MFASVIFITCNVQMKASKKLKVVALFGTRLMFVTFILPFRILTDNIL
jgi:hypothetical protein